MVRHWIEGPKRVEPGRTETWTAVSRSRYVDRVEWYVDGEKVDTGPSLTRELFTHGTHSVQATFVLYGGSRTHNAIQRVTVGDGFGHRLKMAKAGLILKLRRLLGTR